MTHPCPTCGDTAKCIGCIAAECFGPPIEPIPFDENGSREPLPRATLEPYPLDEDGSNGSRESATALGSDDGSGETDRTRARALALGIAVPLGAPFASVVPGQDGRQAALYPSGRGGYWRYRCGEWTGGLAEVRASIAYGRPRRCDAGSDRIGTTEISRWRERLDYDAGLRRPRTVLHALPDELSAEGAAVARGVLLLLALRLEGWEGDTFTFSRDFAVAYCGLSIHAARKGIEELQRRGFLVKVGMRGRAYEYRLGGPARPVRQEPARLLIDVVGSDAAVFAALGAAFDAEELVA